MTIRAVIADLDGCVYVGDRPLEGVAEAISVLRRMGVKVLFMTNNATKKPEDYASKLRSMGVEASPKDILTSGVIAASYIKEAWGPSRVMVVGSRALEEVLEEFGHIRVTSNADVVVAGLDFDFNYAKLRDASREVRRGARFVATNTDATVPVEHDVLPGAGSIVKAIEVASGVKPIVVGKPSKIALREAMRRLKVKPSEVVVVGDRVETDVKMGKRLKCTTVLVLTGVTSTKDLGSLPRRLRPDFVIESLKNLPELLAEA
ncbi:MAG: HAD family hydrolase [Thermoprotei archaeon]|nr:MAG: HAD family hydrolase [Thermoprotei archaeon]